MFFCLSRNHSVTTLFVLFYVVESSNWQTVKSKKKKVEEAEGEWNKPSLKLFFLCVCEPWLSGLLYFYLCFVNAASRHVLHMAVILYQQLGCCHQIGKWPFWLDFTRVVVHNDLDATHKSPFWLLFSRVCRVLYEWRPTRHIHFGCQFLREELKSQSRSKWYQQVVFLNRQTSMSMIQSNRMETKFSF